jgi:hypothetical protein
MNKITNQKELRRVFWETYPDLQKKKITDYSGNGKMHVTDTRCAFADFIDQLRRDDLITSEMAQKVTL